MDIKYFPIRIKKNSVRRNKQNKIKSIIIISFIVIISSVSIPMIIYAYSAIKSIIGYNQDLPCEDLPDIETVQQTIEDHQDVIQEIEDLSPGYISVEINERCNGKGELYIYYDTLSNREHIVEIIGAETFFGIPYRLFNV
jgi:hypothetical protein